MITLARAKLASFGAKLETECSVLVCSTGLDHALVVAYSVSNFTPKYMIHFIEPPESFFDLPNAGSSSKHL